MNWRLERRVVSVLTILYFVLVAAGCTWYVPPEADPQLKKLDWLVGDWSTSLKQPDSATEEHWMAPKTSNMFGVGRTLRNGREESIEYLRIAAEPSGLVYYAAPAGRLPATPFRAVETGLRHVVFENPEHDYPQRIIYELQFGSTIKVRIEGEVDGQMKSSEWVYYIMR